MSALSPDPSKGVFIVTIGKRNFKVRKMRLTELQSAVGLQVKEIANKGLGVIATKQFDKGDFVCEYEGTLMDRKTARERENSYANTAAQEHPPWYMYYFRWPRRAGSSGDGRKWCIDATHSNSVGRFINHSRKRPNMKPTLVFDEERNLPHLVFLASCRIDPGDELCYDYGDRDPRNVKEYPWLAQ